MSERFRVLLIDDDGEEFILTRDLIEDLVRPSIELEWVGSYQAGLAAVLAGEHDAFLLDYRLGGRDGLELLQEARQLGASAPIIMLTGQGNLEVDVAAMQAGAVDYLVKGQFAPDMLERTIRYAVERARALEALRQSEAALKEAQRIAKVGSWEWDVRSGEVLWSDQMYQIFDITPEQRRGKILGNPESIHPEDRERVREAVEQVTLAFKTDPIEFRLVAAEGEKWVLARGSLVTNSSGEVVRVLGTLQDITERRRIEQQLFQLAYHDPLTGLPNRRFFLEQLERIAGTALRSGQVVGVVFVDVDRFKAINDTLGHAAGDQLLITVAQRIQENLRSDDFVARMSGDEFAVILPNLRNEETAEQVVQKLVKVLGAPIQMESRSVYVTASLGLSLYPWNGMDASTLLRHADVAMYAAKQAGRNTYKLYRPEMTSDSLERFELEADLWRAIENGEFELHYQPQLDLQKRQITGVEALIRWRHPSKGLIPPGKFIPIAEENGMIIRLGAWVLREACRQNKAWQQQGLKPLKVAVNVSSLQFGQADLVETVSDALAGSGLGVQWLELELTESLVMKDVESSAHMMGLLREIGVSIAVDDFGTGYSSLAYLQRLPIDALKIDRSFVNQMDSGEGGLALIRAIVALSHGLGIAVVAEGVETEGQSNHLRELGCDSAQGYLFARPAPASEVEKYLSPQKI